MLKSLTKLLPPLTQGNIAIQVQPKANFFGWLLPYFNQVDYHRLEQVGPDRACAEWLLKNGAHVKWVDSEKFVKDYNSLPVSGGRSWKVQEVDATEASITEHGFLYFKGLKHFDKLRLKNCKYG